MAADSQRLSTATTGVHSGTSAPALSIATSPAMFFNVPSMTVTGGTYIQIHNIMGNGPGFEKLSSQVAHGALHNSEKNWNRPPCHKGTRQDVISKITTWAQREAYREALVLWMFGMVGVGKSAIAQSLAENFSKSGILLAAFFFSRDDNTRCNAKAFIATIVYQMGLALPDLRPYIETVIGVHPHVFSLSISEQMSKLVIEPLQQFLANGHVVTHNVLVVDGLDECGEEENQRHNIIKALAHLVEAFRHANPPFLVALSSRPEKDIKDTFRIKATHSQIMKIDLNREFSPNDDIRTFLQDCFDDLCQTRESIHSPWPSETQLRALLLRSSGHFIYASTAIKFISSYRHDPQKRLETILEAVPADDSDASPFAPLDALYRHIFASLPEHMLQDSLLILSTLLALGNRSYVEHLAEILLMNVSSVQVIVDNLGSIVSYVDGEITTLHLSMSEFLASASRAQRFHRDPSFWYLGVPRLLSVYQQDGQRILPALKRLGKKLHLHHGLRARSRLSVAGELKGYGNLASRLNRIGLLFSDRSKQSTELENFMSAVSHFQQAIALNSSDDPSYADYLDNLARSLLSRFEVTGDSDDLASAMLNAQHAVDFVTRKRPKNLQTYLHHLRVSALYKRSGISHKRSEIEITLPTHPQLPRYLETLSVSYSRHFRQHVIEEDIGLAISHGEHALQLTPSNHPDLPQRLQNLAISYQSRFKHQGDEEDLVRSISHEERALQLIPPNHPDLPQYLQNIAVSYGSRFVHQGDEEDLVRAISHGERAVQLTPPNHPGFPRCLQTLSVSYWSRFVHQGDEEDLVCAVSHAERAVELTPLNHPALPQRLQNLAVSYRSRFKHQGDEEDLVRAISHEERALQLTPPNHPDIPRRLQNLAVSYKIRFERQGNEEDLFRAISHEERAIHLTPPNHPDLPRRLQNLTVSYKSRFKQQGDGEDLFRAISLEERVLQLTPPNHPDLPKYLQNLGVSYHSRFEHQGDEEDLFRAISYEERALQLTPSNHPELPLRLQNHAISYHARFKIHDSLDDILVAISHQQRAVDLTPPNHRNYPKSSECLQRLKIIHEDFVSRQSPGEDDQ